MKDAEIHIRRYEAADKETVRRLHDEALHEVGAHLGEGSWDDDLDDIGGIYLENDGEFLVGTLEDEIVVMGAFRETSPVTAGLTRMRVSPKVQGHGFGQRLLEALEGRAAKLGYETLHLATTVQQRAAQNLYLKNDYRESGRGTVGSFECIYYEKNNLAGAQSA